jgi:hypothetical protein
VEGGGERGTLRAGKPFPVIGPIMNNDT